MTLFNSTNVKSNFNDTMMRTLWQLVGDTSTSSSSSSSSPAPDVRNAALKCLSKFKKSDIKCSHLPPSVSVLHYFTIRFGSSFRKLNMN